MKTILASVLALGLMTSATVAAESTKSTATQSGRVVLTTAQMDNVRAGRHRFPGNQVAAGNLVNAQVQLDARDLDACVICSDTEQ
jgi:hypothetical protein